MALFANTYDHENTDVGAANRSNYASMTSSPENMFSTENYLNGNYKHSNWITKQKTKRRYAWTKRWVYLRRW